jgi:hypothetical protein
MKLKQKDLDEIFGASPLWYPQLLKKKGQALRVEK